MSRHEQQRRRAQVSARLDPAVAELVEQVAEQERRPVSSLVRNIVTDGASMQVRLSRCVCATVGRGGRHVPTRAYERAVTAASPFVRREARRRLGRLSGGLPDQAADHDHLPRSDLERQVSYPWA